MAWAARTGARRSATWRQYCFALRARRTEPISSAGDSRVDVRFRPLPADEAGWPRSCEQRGLLRRAPVPIESTPVEAQHLSSSSGDADAVTIQSPSRRVVCSTSEAAAVAPGGTSEDCPPVGSDAERASEEVPFLQRRTSGGGRRVKRFGLSRAE